ncbi:putative mitochondrial N-glycosylase/DNA lyase, partial [Saitoella complicata NRRL Y-17804]
MENENRTMNGWRLLQTAANELSLATTLKCGQSFRWKASGENEWSIALRNRIISLRQTAPAAPIHYRAIHPPSSSPPLVPPLDDTEELLHDYLALSVNLENLYAQWTRDDQVFAKLAPRFAGIRILRQPPLENLLSFICSTNNNIARITQMVDKLCVNYGTYIGDLDGVAYYDFPTLETFAEAAARTGEDDLETKLRGMGFGYRAKYIAKTALILAHDHPPNWLEDLRTKTYQEAHESLLTLSGVGPKVADCVCLMSLDQHSAVPVDTHVFQIAVRDYKFRSKGAGKGTGTMNKATCEAVGEFFRTLWGPYAGWAQSVVFTADLRAFADHGREESVTVKEEV